MGLPYSERRERLSELGLSSDGWQTPENVTEDGAALLQATAEQGLEGVLAKRLELDLQAGGTLARLDQGQERGPPGGGDRRMDGRQGQAGQDDRRALDGGVRAGRRVLRYVGRVGSGFSERELGRLEKLLAPLARESSPFQSGERPPREAHLLRARSWSPRSSSPSGPPPGACASPPTRDPRGQAGRARSCARAPPRRASETAGKQQAPGEPELTIEESSAKSATATVGGRELKLSNLEKVLYPDSGFTKRRLIEYYARDRAGAAAPSARAGR